MKCYQPTLPFPNTWNWVRFPYTSLFTWGPDNPLSLFLHQANHTIDFDTGSALVLTIESTLITACSSESLVSKGHFKNFCIRFAEGFETTWDDWKPEVRGDLVMNACEWYIILKSVIFVTKDKFYLCFKIIRFFFFNKRWSIKYKEWLLTVNYMALSLCDSWLDFSRWQHLWNIDWFLSFCVQV